MTQLLAHLLKSHLTYGDHIVTPHRDPIHQTHPLIALEHENPEKTPAMRDGVPLLFFIAKQGIG